MAFNDYGALIYEVKNNTVREITSSFADKTLYWNGTKWEYWNIEDDLPDKKEIFCISGHAIIITDRMVASFEKRKFPKIFTFDNGNWKEKSYLSIIKDRCKTDKYYSLNPDLIMGTHYNADTDEFIREPIEVDFNTLYEFYIRGIEFTVEHYKYFDTWYIDDNESDTEYYVVIGQGLGSGFENRYLTKYIKKHIDKHPSFNGVYISYPKNPFHMHLENFIALSIHKDYKKSRRIILRYNIHKLFSDLFSGKFNKLKKDIHNIKLMWMYN